MPHTMFGSGQFLTIPRLFLLGSPGVALFEPLFPQFLHTLERGVPGFLIVVGPGRGVLNVLANYKV
jgi:hypothetical protein